MLVSKVYYFLTRAYIHRGRIPVELKAHEVINDSFHSRGAKQHSCTFARF
jgi:hypothetical protein